MPKKKCRSKKGKSQSIKSQSIKPWYSRYGQLQLQNVVTGVIPKRIRNILAAHDRLDRGTSAGAAASEWRNIDKNLADIEDAFSKIETALVEGEDISRWKEFPGLDGAVKQVRGTAKLLDAQARRIPGGSFNFDFLRAFDDASPGKTTVVKSNPAVKPSPAVKSTPVVKPSPFATGANGEPLQKRTKDEVKVKVKVEDEDEIEEGEIVIKNEEDDQPGVPLDVGSPERLPSPESVDLHHNSQAQPQRHDYPYTTGFCDYLPGPSAHWNSQPPFPRPFYPQNYWNGVPNDYWHTPLPLVNPPAVMAHYNSGFVGFAPAGTIGQAYRQLTYGSNHSYPPSRAVPQHFGATVAVSPGNPPAAFLPAPPPPPPSITPASPIRSPKPSPKPSLEKAPPSSPMVTQPLEYEQVRKRKLSDSPGSSGSSRPLKRRFSVQVGTLLDVDDDHHDHTKFPRSASGPPDFGAWFQEQVADSKKKLSQLERASKPTANSHDP